MRSFSFVCLLSLAAFCGSCGSSGLKWYDYRVVETYPHDPAAYCQGLVFDDGKLYESTGRNGTSTVRSVDPESGKVLSQKRLPDSLFGEGLALHNDELFQLTWQAGKGHVFKKDTLEIVRQFSYEGEGWGLTSDGTHLIMSDGTAHLTFRDPETFEIQRTLKVQRDKRAISSLNELEFIDGLIWANIWKSDQIAQINPETGEVEGVIDLKGIFDYSSINDLDAVPNGIAWDASGRRLFVTGKLWPSIFQIELASR